MWGKKTLDTTSESLKRINIRRLLIYIDGTVNNYLRELKLKPNNREEIREAIL